MLHLLAEHKVMTTAQLTTALFTGPRTAYRRLARLSHWGLLARFTPPRAPLRSDGAGAGQGTCWILGVLGARYVALAHGHRPPTAHAVRERQDAVAASTHLAHTLGVNQVLADLLAHTRTHPDTRLARWWPSVRIAAALGRRLRPDAHGVWCQDTRQVAFFLEYDTGTETLAHLAAKIDAYRRLRVDGGPAWPVLLHLPSPTRETNLHQHLAATPSLTATASTTPTPGPATGTVVVTTTRTRCRETGPARPVWRLVGCDQTLRHLIDLPSLPGRPGPYHPGPPALGEDPLHLLRP